MGVLVKILSNPSIILGSLGIPLSTSYEKNGKWVVHLDTSRKRNLINRIRWRISFYVNNERRKMDGWTMNFPSIIVLDDPSHCTRKYINISLVNTIQFIKICLTRKYYINWHEHIFLQHIIIFNIHLITLACTHVYAIKMLSKSVA